MPEGPAPVIPEGNEESMETEEQDPSPGGGPALQKKDGNPEVPSAHKPGGRVEEKEANDDKEWNCEKCDHQASTEDFLRKHMKVKHNESLKTLICTFCKARFSSKREMARHRKDNHFTYKMCMNMENCEFQEECYYSHTPIPNGKHRCFQCGKDFDSKREMMGHRKNEHEDIKTCMDRQCKRGQNCWWRHELRTNVQKGAECRGGKDFH